MARAVKLIGLTAGLGVVAAVVVALLAPSRAPAQNPAAPAAAAPAAAAALPAGYVGADTCKACHEPAFQKFSSTKMGRLFLHSPRNAKEGLACENCHGPGQAHVEAGGGKGKGGLITFAKNDKTPVTSATRCA